MSEDGKAWSPYLAGALTGLLMVASVWFTGKYFGASTSFVRTAGMLEQLVAPDRVAVLEYFVKESPKIDWQWMFVFGILLGSLLSSLTSKTFKWQAVPDSWREFQGPSKVKRWAVAFLGGIVAMFGARLAGG